jgi:hypothetical protein
MAKGRRSCKYAHPLRKQVVELGQHSIPPGVKLLKHLPPLEKQRVVDAPRADKLCPSDIFADVATSPLIALALLLMRLRHGDLGVYPVGPTSSQRRSYVGFQARSNGQGWCQSES